MFELKKKLDIEYDIHTTIGHAIVLKKNLPERFPSQIIHTKNIIHNTSLAKENSNEIEEDSNENLKSIAGKKRKSKKSKKSHRRKGRRTAKKTHR